jgi:hypothetical protein
MPHTASYGTTPEPSKTSPLWDAEDLGEPESGAPSKCPGPTDVVTVPGFDEALVYAFKGDNQGPQNAAEVKEAVGCVKKMFPTAELVSVPTISMIRPVFSKKLCISPALEPLLHSCLPFTRLLLLSVCAGWVHLRRFRARVADEREWH